MTPHLSNVDATSALTMSKLLWGPKLRQKVNIEDLEIVVFLGGKNHYI